MLVYEFNYDSSNLNCKWIVLGNKKLNRGFCQDPSLHFFSSLSTMTIIIIKNNNCKTQSQELPKSSTDVFLGIVSDTSLRQTVRQCNAKSALSSHGVHEHVWFFFGIETTKSNEFAKKNVFVWYLWTM